MSAQTAKKIDYGVAEMSEDQIVREYLLGRTIDGLSHDYWYNVRRMVKDGRREAVITKREARKIVETAVYLHVMRETRGGQWEPDEIIYKPAPTRGVTV